MTRLNRRDALIRGSALGVFLPFVNACAPKEAKTTETTTSGENGFMDGVRTAELIASGEMTASEAVEAAISRAEAVEPQINAIASETFDLARERAATSPQGQFGGVPTFIKDLFDWNKAPTYFGSQAFKGYVATQDEAASAAWRKAGMISLGKSTTPELGLTATTETLVTGESRNPWNLDHSTGGSSGGAGALVAARVVPFAHATDGGGSIRIPASCNGVFGLKPSRDRTYFRVEPQLPVSISVSHAETITVRDSVATFRVSQTGKFDDIGAISGPSTKRLRIGVLTSPATDVTVDPELITATERTAELCRELGHEVFEFKFPSGFDGQEFSDKFSLYWSAGAAQFVQQASEFTGKPPSPEIVEPLTLFLAQRFMERQGELEAAVQYLLGFKDIYDSWFSSMDVMLSPTLAELPLPIGTLGATTDPEEHFARVSSYASFTPPMNVSGAASMSVPLEWSESGLPIGMMFSGKQGDDEMLFELAYELEQARPWVNKVPPVHA